MKACALRDTCTATGAGLMFGNTRVRAHHIEVHNRLVVTLKGLSMELTHTHTAADPVQAPVNYPDTNIGTLSLMRRT